MAKDSGSLVRRIVVTGSGSGIGAAICRGLAGPGVGILVHALSNESGCERVAAEIESAGGRALVQCADLSAPGAGRALVESVVDAFGGLDVLIANAGFPYRGSFSDLEREDLEQCFAAMPAAFFEMAKAALPALSTARDGRVIAVSAHSAHMFRATYPIFPASAAAKRAMEVLVHSLAIELAPRGVTVNAVVPGLITKDSDRDAFLTEEERQALVRQVPMARFGSAAEVASVVRFLASPEASYVTNQVIHVNGGMV